MSNITLRGQLEHQFDAAIDTCTFGEPILLVSLLFHSPQHRIYSSIRHNCENISVGKQFRRATVLIIEVFIDFYDK